MREGVSFKITEEEVQIAFSLSFHTIHYECSIIPFIHT